MKAFRDFDHLELLVQYRVSVGQWVKATDAFLFFINEEPSIINEDPARFFLPVHTLLMQHKEAADAGKLCKIALEQYNLPEEIQIIMQSDVLFALGFYDRVIPLYEKMKETSVDPVLDFNLAVANLYMLYFEKADCHLSKYERFFSHLPENAERTARLRLMVDCCRKKAKLDRKSQAHPLERLEWDDTLELLMRNTQKNSIFLGVDTLYKIEKAGKWDLLDHFQRITVCTLTTVELMDLYLETGDSAFFSVIMHLASLPQLEIQSPELDYYLALDISNRDVPPLVKMEQALYLQEQQRERNQ